MGLMISSLVLAALMGAGALLMGLGDVTVRSLVTALSIALFSVVSLGCVWSWEHGRRHGAAVAGLILSGVTFVVYMLFIWADTYISWRRRNCSAGSWRSVRRGRC